MLGYLLFCHSPASAAIVVGPDLPVVLLGFFSFLFFPLSISVWNPEAYSKSNMISGVCHLEEIELYDLLFVSSCSLNSQGEGNQP